jgi:penicillin-binding protein 1A
MTMRSALRISSNRAAVQMLTTVGIPNAVTESQKLNMGTPPSVPSLALGSSEVTLMSMTAAYGAFADGGLVRTPVLIRRVEDDEGKILYENRGGSQRAISEASAFLMSSMLADVINAGTAYKARQSGFTLPAAGKTGTTNDYVDAWFVGYTPHIVTGVWVGFDQPKTIIRNGYAADVAVPIWAAFMKTATKDDKPDWFDRPSNVVGVNVCRISGKLPSNGCYNVTTADDEGNLENRSMVYTDYFVKGTQPTTTCPLHTDANYITATAGVPTGAIVPGEHAILPPPPPQGTAGAAPADPSQPAASGEKVDKKETDKDKKRGFWSKLFGRGKKNGDKNDKGGDKGGGGA